MVDVCKEKNYVNFETFKVKTNEGEFEISFEENRGLYIGFCKKNESLLPGYKTFEITRENEYLYKCIDELYESFKNNNPKINGEPNPKKNSLVDIVNKLNNPYKDGKIEWLSDDFNEEEASKLIIEKNTENDSYKFSFIKSKSKEKINTYFVCVSCIKSRYINFNDLFIKLYMDLLPYKKENTKTRTRR